VSANGRISKLERRLQSSDAGGIKVLTWRHGEPKPEVPDDFRGLVVTVRKPALTDGDEQCA
jgi:hypothetical protein